MVAMVVRQLAIDNRPQLGSFLAKLPLTSSTAQGGGQSFKNRKPIGEVGCCESGMAGRIH